MNLFDLHCDTAGECYNQKLALLDGGMHLNLCKGKNLDKWAQVFAIWIPDELRGEKSKKYFDNVLLNFKNEILLNNSKIKLCQEFSDFTECKNSNKCAAILACEGASPFADFEGAYRAKELGVKVALENTEGEDYLACLMDVFKDYENVGFCWDTGHEMCYNNSMDVPALFGDKLICTHLNDNLGQTDPNVITWLDDSHLFPFDGIADWQGIAERLDRINYSGELTFELTLASKPGKNTHDIYKDLTLDSYFKLVYDKAVQFAQLLK